MVSLYVCMHACMYVCMQSCISMYGKTTQTPHTCETHSQDGPVLQHIYAAINTHTYRPDHPPMSYRHTPLKLLGVPYTWWPCSHIYTHTYIYKYTCMHACIRIYIHTYAHIHIHTNLVIHQCLTGKNH
jgi:hypothetical protein